MIFEMTANSREYPGFMLLRLLLFSEATPSPSSTPAGLSTPTQGEQGDGFFNLS